MEIKVGDILKVQRGFDLILAGARIKVVAVVDNAVAVIDVLDIAQVITWLTREKIELYWEVEKQP